MQQRLTDRGGRRKNAACCREGNSKPLVLSVGLPAVRWSSISHFPKTSHSFQTGGEVNPEAAKQAASMGPLTDPGGSKRAVISSAAPPEFTALEGGMQEKAVKDTASQGH